ncbi:hypothetical protein [Pseudonocardia acaciae]|uniref:hypothetical protein n=1 Tax=Pseudonocardia acaciae TaxID=551276 RepID=UPI00056B0DC3|nr:hypothetical protein [Pseudonocardia acaciae]
MSTTDAYAASPLPWSGELPLSVARAIRWWYVWIVPAAILVALALATPMARDKATRELDTTTLVIGVLFFGALSWAVLSYVVRRFQRGRGWAVLTLAGLWGAAMIPTLDVVGSLVEDVWQLVTAGTVGRLMIICAIAQMVAGLGATCLSLTTEARGYLAECRTARLAMRPTPGPAPTPLRLAYTAWYLAAASHGVAWLVAVLAFGFLARAVADPVGWVLGPGLALGIAFGARYLSFGSKVARRWLVALGALVVFLSSRRFDGVPAHVSVMAGLIIAAVVAGAVLSYLPASRTYLHSAQPR